MTQTNQVYLYSVTTKAFYNEQEKAKQNEFYELLNKNKELNKKIKVLASSEYKEIKLNNKLIKKTRDKNQKIELKNKNKELDKEIKLIAYSEFEQLDDNETEMKKIKDELDIIIKDFTGVRELSELALTEKRVIAQFQSAFTRALKIENDSNNPTTDFMIVQVYEYAIMDSLVKNGFDYKGEHYRYVFSSAGQVRTKKTIFINEAKYSKIENKLTAGLTREDINKNGGISINKYLAYSALCNSSSIKWEGFDINKAIVVNDFKFTMKDKEVDYIGSDYEVTRKRMEVTNEVMDGCGVMLPSISDTNIQFRGIFFKGLLTSFDFKSFIGEHNANPIVTDVWGKEWDIIKEDIHVIFTASQFKMWKYFSEEIEVEEGKKLKGWDLVKYRYEKYGCEFSICDIEGEMFKDVRVNYQMLQTLHKMPQEDLEIISSNTKSKIENATATTQSMIEFVGVTKDKKHKQPWEEALLMYPELINDDHFRNMIKTKKASLVKDARSGKIVIPNSKRMYIIPDCYAMCQWLFGLEVTGLINDKEVSCKLYDDNKELTVLRSPHLYLEHSINTNIVNERVSKWFTTNGIYTSIFSDISKILQFDNDGDTALVIDDETFLKNAKDHMKNIVPLQYEMGVAEAREINNDNILSSLKDAFKINIGDISNNISKIFGQDEITADDLTLVKRLVFQNNLAIDYAKTCFFAEPPKAIKKKINKLKNNKLPAFFMMAKDKTSDQVLERNDSTVNRLYEIMKTKRLSFSKTEFDYTKLMKNPDVVIDNAIVKKYTEITATKYFKLQSQLELQGDTPTQLFAIQTVREELLKTNNDVAYVTDVLVKYLHENKSEYKKFLWDCFGERILYNLKNSLGKLKTCKSCPEKFDPTSNRQVLCVECGEVAKREATKIRKLKFKNKQIS